MATSLARVQQSSSLFAMSVELASPLSPENPPKIFTYANGASISIFVDAGGVSNSPKLLKTIRVSLVFFFLYIELTVHANRPVVLKSSISLR
jgi:hypothetical protein